MPISGAKTRLRQLPTLKAKPPHSMHGTALSLTRSFLKSDDFTLITKDDKYAYTFNNINPDTQISLSDDEIKTGFSTLDQSGI